MPQDAIRVGGVVGVPVMPRGSVTNPQSPNPRGLAWNRAQRAAAQCQLCESVLDGLWGPNSSLSVLICLSCLPTGNKSTNTVNLSIPMGGQRLYLSPN